MDREFADWRDAEREFRRPSYELARLVRRGRPRALAAVLASLLVAAAMTLSLAMRASHHEAHLILRVSEGIISDGAGMPRGELRGYVESALLTRPILSELIEAEELFLAERERGEQFAIEALRRALDIEVYGNFFATWERIGARSLRIRITYRAAEHEEASAVTRALARMIVRAELAQRRGRFDDTSELSEAIVARAQDRMDRRQRDLTDRLVELRRAELARDVIDAGNLRLQARHLAGRLQADHQSLRGAMLEQTELAFRRAAAHARLGILFRVVDEVVPSPPRLTRWPSRLAMGGMMFLLLLPFAGLAAGAFDPRLHERADVARLGLSALGHVPRARGPRRPPHHA